MKKLLYSLLILVFALTLFACKKKNETVKTKANPMVSNPDEVFASLKEKDNTYTVKNNELYLTLKVQAGTDTLLNIVDKYLISNVDGKNYLNSVTTDEIKEAIDEDIYGKDADLTDEEKDEKLDEFLETMFVSMNIEATDPYDSKIQEVYRLSLAEKAYAKDVLVKEVKERDDKYAEYEAMDASAKAKVENPVTSPYFADSKYQAKYEKDNYNEYNAIIVTFPSYRLANIALQSIGVTVEDGKWAGLSDDQVVSKFIELYNYNYGYKGLDLNVESEEFHFTQSELNAVNANIATRVKDKMVCKGEEGTWYYGEPFETGSGSLYTFILKLSETKAKAWADLTDEEKEAEKANYLDDLYEDTLTSAYLATKLAELRASKGFKIYDTVLEMNYASLVGNTGVEFSKTNDEKTSVVASVEGKEFTADELFSELVKSYAVSGATSILVNKRLINNPELDPYYHNGTWDDQNKKAELQELVKAEKNNFENGTYTSHGYDPTTSSWETFLEASYSVRTEDDLLLYYLTDAVSTLYTKGLNYIVSGETDKDGVTAYEKTVEELETSNLWVKLTEKMQEEVDAFFNVKGIHLLICAYKDVNAYIAGSSALDPKEWTDEQNEKANALATEIIAFVGDGEGTYQQRLQDLVEAFTLAPSKPGTYTFAGKEVKTTVTSAGGNVTINVSEYKSYGLYLKYESLGTFANGSMVDEFNDAVKALYDAEVALEQVGADKSKVVICPTPIKTKFGYHVYVNLQCNEQAYAKKTPNKTVDPDTQEEVEDGTYTYRYLPTIEEIRIYTADNSSSSIDSNVKNAITRYYTNYSSELSGTYFTQAMRYHALKSLSITSKDVRQDAFTKYLDFYVGHVFESNLKYLTEDFLETK